MIIRYVDFNPDWLCCMATECGAGSLAHTGKSILATVAALNHEDTHR